MSVLTQKARGYTKVTLYYLHMLGDNNVTIQA